MIELPSTPWLSDPGAAADPRWQPAATRLEAVPGTVRHLFTHVDLAVTLMRGHVTSATEELWATPADFSALALPTLTRKLLRHAGLRC
jgi:A/G-specific adenine glycosylase